MRPLTLTATAVAAAMALAACDRAPLSNPVKQPADAPTWKQGEAPVASAGLTVTKLATGLQHPRAIYPLPNGDILIVEATGPAAPVLRPADLLKHSAGTPGAGGLGGRITLVRPDPDGGPARQTVFLDHLAAPGGVALVGTDLYVTQTDALMRYPYNTGDTRITAAGTKIVDLPAGPINRFWARSLLASDDGARLYVGVGASSNVGENGMVLEAKRAAILEVVRATGAVRTFANGLRNPDGMQWEPRSQAMWVVVDEREGAEPVPDYLTSVREGAFYGWPYSYNGAHVDPRAMPQRPDLVARAVAPDMPLDASAAPMGLAFNNPVSTMPEQLRDGAFFSLAGGGQGGAKVVFVPFIDGKPAGPPVDVVTGFGGGGQNVQVKGRPAGLMMDHRGALLIADDVGNTVWRVSGPPLR